MKGALLLLTHSLKRVRILLIAIGLLLFGFQVALILAARSIEISGGFAQLTAMLPPFARDLMGPSMVGFMTFGGIVCLGYFHLVVMSSLVAVAIALATIPTSEIETGFIDLILARPLARHWVISRTIVLGIVSIAALLAMMVLGTWVGLSTLAPKGAEWPSVALIIALVENLGLLLLCWSGVAMAIGAASRRRGVAGATAGFLALATFLMDVVGRIWQRADAVAWLSPFRYYSPLEMITGNAVPVKNLLILGTIAVVGFTLAYIVFSKRDIAH